MLTENHILTAGRNSFGIQECLDPFLVGFLVAIVRKGIEEEDGAIG